MLSEAAGDGGSITVAYCSTQPTEARWGAAHVWVDPAAAANAGCGLSRPTCVYPSRPGSYVPEALGRPAGRLAAALPSIQRELRVALGLGTGVCGHTDLPRGNRRGRIVLLNDAFAAMTGYAHGLVITEPRYSRHGRQQLIVPVLPGDEFEETALDVVVRERPWIGQAFPRPEPRTFATSLVTSVFEPDWVAGYTSAVVDATTMESIDEALMAHFALPTGG